MEEENKGAHEEEIKNIENESNEYPLDHKEPTWTFRSRDIIYYVLGIIEVLLLFRLIFRSLGANATNAVVSSLYGITYALILPFIGIFKAIMPSGTSTYIIEPATIIAMIVYALIAYGIVKLVKVVA